MRGGKRKGAGRKPVKDKKIAVVLYIRKSIIDRFGGMDKLKKKLSESVSR